MKIDLPNVCNARDIGGMKTKYGVIKQGKFIRSGVLNRLNGEDVEILKKYNLKRVIDLRTSMETETTPDVKIDGVEYLNVSVVRSVTFGISFESLDGPILAERLQAGYERMQKKGEEYPEHMENIYRRYVYDDHCRNAYGTFLKTLANNPSDGATLWHCTMGKDRVGTCTALLEYCLGASSEQIYEDFMLSNTQTQDNTNSVLNKAKPFVPAERLELIESMLMVQRYYLDAFFDEIKNRFGDSDGFLSACGVTVKDKENLRKLYLE